MEKRQICEIMKGRGREGEVACSILGVSGGKFCNFYDMRFGEVGHDWEMFLRECFVSKESCLRLYTCLIRDAPSTLFSCLPFLPLALTNALLSLIMLLHELSKSSLKSENKQSACLEFINHNVKSLVRLLHLLLQLFDLGFASLFVVGWIWCQFAWRMWVLDGILSFWMRSVKAEMVESSCWVSCFGVMVVICSGFEVGQHWWCTGEIISCLPCSIGPCDVCFAICVDDKESNKWWDWRAYFLSWWLSVEAKSKQANWTLLMQEVKGRH